MGNVATPCSSFGHYFRESLYLPKDAMTGQKNSRSSFQDRGRRCLVGLLSLWLFSSIPAIGARERPLFQLSSGESEIRVFANGEQNEYRLGYYLNGRLRVSSGKGEDYLTIQRVPGGETYPGAISAVRQLPLGLEIQVSLEACGLRCKEAIRPRIADRVPYFESTIEVVSDSSQELLILRPYRLEGARQPFFLVPGYFYGTNNAEQAGDVFPQLAYRGGTDPPKSSIHFFRSDRSSHAAVEAYFRRCVFAVATEEGCRPADGPEPFSYNGLGLDTSPAGGDRVFLTLGYRNFPARYNGNCPKRLAPRWEAGPESRGIRLQPGRPLVNRQFLYLGKADDRFGFENAQRAFYWALHKKPAAKASRAHATRAIAQALVEDAVVPECDLFRVIDKSNECDIGWTGGMMVAYPLLRAAIQLDDTTMMQTALQAADTLCENGFSQEAGFFFDAYRDGQWTTEGWWTHWSGGAHLAYTNGQAAFSILKMHALLPASRRSEKNLWLQRVRRILDTARREQRTSGEYPVAYDPATGEGLDRPGFAGCWFVPAMAEFYGLTGERQYLRSAQRAERFYFDWLSTYEVWGTPIDAANATDQEGNLAFVTGCVSLHQVTGKPKYLDHALRGLHYDLSWKYAYRTYLASDPLRSLDWDSTGGNATSCCNIHLHPMGTLLADAYWRLYRQTGDPYLFERLQDTLIFSLGTYNRTEGEFGFGKTGWVTEQFYHTDAIQGETPSDGGIWHRFLPWAGACVLSGLTAEIPDDLFR